MTTRVEEHTASVVAHGVTLIATAWCVVVTCDGDGCTAQHVSPGTDEEHATREAAAAGWWWDGGERDLCRACDEAPRCRVCDAVATDATARLCVACAGEA